MTPLQPIITALDRRRDSCTVDKRQACREPSFNTHLLPTGTNTGQVCVDDNQVLETGRCSSYYLHPLCINIFCCIFILHDVMENGSIRKRIHIY